MEPQASRSLSERDHSFSLPIVTASSVRFRQRVRGHDDLQGSRYPEALEKRTGL
jgi:hypothetical protein